MASQFMDFIMARAMRNNPALANQMMYQQRLAQEQSQSNSLSKVLSEIIGTDPSQQQSQVDPMYNNYISRASKDTGYPVDVMQKIASDAAGSPNATVTGPNGTTNLPQELLNVDPGYGANIPNNSMYSANPLSGGSGLLGQDMDPVRRSYLTMIKRLADSGSPMAVNMAAELLKNVQESSLKDIERPSNIKSLMMSGIPMGSQDMRHIIEQSMIKPQTQINMGSNQPLTPMTDEQMQQFGLPTGTGHTKYVVDKNGIPQPVEAKTGTEAQSKATFYASNMAKAHNTLNNTQNNVDYTKLGIKHIINNVPWAGEFLSSQYANPKLTSDEQLFDNAVEQFVAGVNRSESGATITEQEWQKARNRFIPSKGDKPAVIAQKAKNRETATRLMMESGGILGQSQLEEFDKAINAAKDAKEMPTTKKDSLPQLPEGFRWED